MKLTPEQKAFYEYGQAVKVLNGTINQIRKNALHEFGEPYHLLMRNEQKCLINAMGLASKIHVVRQKRAACRAWVPAEERYCSNCRHINEIADVGTICEKCPHYNGSYYDENKWEPRKEASND